MVLSVSLESEMGTYESFLMFSDFILMIVLSEGEGT